MRKVCGKTHLFVGSGGLLGWHGKIFNSRPSAEAEMGVDETVEPGRSRLVLLAGPKSIEAKRVPPSRNTNNGNGAFCADGTFSKP